MDLDTELEIERLKEVKEKCEENGLTLQDVLMYKLVVEAQDIVRTLDLYMRER